MLLLVPYIFLHPNTKRDEAQTQGLYLSLGHTHTTHTHTHTAHTRMPPMRGVSPALYILYKYYTHTHTHAHAQWQRQRQIPRHRFAYDLSSCHSEYTLERKRSTQEAGQPQYQPVTVSLKKKMRDT